MSKKRKFTALLLFFFFLGSLMGALYTHRVSARSEGKEGVYEKLKLFTEVMEIVQREYVEEVKPEDLIIGAIQGMLQSLDPHSSYLTPDMFKELQVETKGSFGGLGIEIGIRDGILTVISPIEDTPAWRAGIKAGDKIIKIDGEPTKGLSLMECVKRLRGPKGTKVTITIMREGFTEPKDFTIVRDIIKIKSVKARKLENGFVYLRIAQFQERTADDFSKAIEDLEKETKIRGMVLDLRSNPGGLLNQAVEIADFFLDKGVIVTVKGRGEERMEFRAKEEGTLPHWPVVVLVNHGSASASEIVAGALQDYGRAVIMGRRTFGKGSVQTIIPLEDGSGIRLTTARYFTPKGRSIQEKGIEPDITLEHVEIVRDGEDPAIKEALKHLKALSIYWRYLEKEEEVSGPLKEVSL